jgi:Tfp pilus assembly protein FimV
MSTIAISPRLTAAPRPAPPARLRPARLRLTRRGRVVFTTLAALPLVVGALVFSLNGGTAWGSLEGSNASFEYVTVESGQSLWQVAELLAPTADPRDVIDALMQLNGLVSADVYAGQELAIPAEYAD